MADQTASWTLKLDDEMSGAANEAAAALKKLESAIASDTKELAAMQKALKNLQAAAKPNTEQIDKLKQQIDASRQSIAKSQSEFIGLGGKFTTSGAKAKGFEARMQALVKSAQQMPGPLGQMATGFAKLQSALGGGAIALGIMGIVAAVVALTAATAAGVASLYRYGVAQADARRSEALRLEGLTKMRSLFTRIPGNAKEMQAAIDQVAASTPIARDQVAKYNEQLYQMGLRGPALSKALEGVAIKSAVQGEEAANAFGQWAAGAALTGRSVDVLVDKVKSRLGGTAQKMMASTTVQALKQKEAFDSLFSGLEIEDYLTAWKGVNDLLSQSTASGRALKTLMQTVLQPLINASADAAFAVKRFFQGVIIGALEIAIKLAEVRNWWIDTFGGSETKKAMDDGRRWVELGKFALYGFAVVLGVAAVAALRLSVNLGARLLTALVRVTWSTIKYAFTAGPAMVRSLLSMASGAWAAVPALWAAVAPMLPFVLAALGVAAAIASLIYYWDELAIAFEQVDLWQLGKDMLEGLLRGLLPGPLVDHMKNLASLAIDAFKTAIGSKSPAKAFVKVGTTIPEGVAAGIDQGSPEAQRAAAGMVDVPQLGGPGAGGGTLEDGGSGGAAAAGGGRGVSIEIGQISINASSDKPEQLALDFRRELERVLEGLALELGAPVPGGAA